MKRFFPIAMLMILATSCEKNKDAGSEFQVNNAASVAEWKGSAPDHFHIGSFQVNGSFTSTPNGMIKAGNFIIPIASIKNFDLPEEVKPQLLDHLKSPDFFNMALHPNAEFRITKVQPYNKNETGAIDGANYLLTGDFSMVGQTHPVSFPAKIYKVADSIKAEATFKLDRTKWGMNSYTDPSKELYIYPDVDMHLKIAAGKK